MWFDADTIAGAKRASEPKGRECINVPGVPTAVIGKCYSIALSAPTNCSRRREAMGVGVLRWSQTAFGVCPHWYMARPAGIASITAHQT
jgi:hypothetical protein